MANVDTAPESAVRQEIVLSAVVTRVDGTVEDFGEIAYWHPNPIKRMLARVRGVRGKVNPA